MSYEHKLLVARPIIADPVFSGKVVFVVKDGEDGAEGFILNGPTAGKVALGAVAEESEMPKTKEELLKAVQGGEICSEDLCYGGPCSAEGFFMVHAYKEFAIEKPEFELGITFNETTSPTIMEGLYFGSPSTVAQIVEANKQEEKKFRFFMGVAAWSDGQLEREIQAGAWEVKELPSPDFIFDLEAIQRMAGKKPDDKPPTRKKSKYELYKPSLN